MAAYERSVFINCPYDPAFEPLFFAIVLTVAARGFIPRSAKETDHQADPRITRIAQGLLDCKYSIHDLSRYQGAGADNLARFNMPLELGMSLGIRYLSQIEGRTTERPHNWMVLVPASAGGVKFISDLAGYDPKTHDETPEGIIKEVAAWLKAQVDAPAPQLPAKKILDAYPDYCDALDKSKVASLGVLDWPTMVKAADEAVAAIGAT